MRKKKMKFRTTIIAGALAGLLPSLALASCGAAFCTVNTNWTTQGALNAAGSSFDLRYEYIDQDRPFAGSDSVAVGAIHHHHDEVGTVNRNVVATYSRSFGDGWGLTLSAPVGQRDHVHIHNHHGEKVSEQWKFTELGDVRAIGRHQVYSGQDPLNPSTAGVTFGLKLPTGRTTMANDDGDAAERSMQPGTGTTDLIVGAYYHQTLMDSDSSWFAQGQYQHALNSHDGYKPGAQFGADMGYRRGFGERLGAVVQLNFVHKRADKGNQAEPADSGGRFVYLSPGLTYGITSNLQVYGFVQQALYRHVNGVQLTADRALLAGISGRF
jgi:Putative MetA-pathway of phenol degradation